MRTFAIDVGGSKFTLAGFEDECLILRESCVTDRAGGPTAMFSRIEQIFLGWQAEQGFKPDRCGIGFGGPVDFPSQSVTFSTHVGGWDSYPLVENIRQLTGAPVVMDNDANVGALGEAVYGAGRGCDPLFYMTLSTGIGGGIVSKGEVYRGADSYGGEIGHMNIEPDGPDCLCGSRGCLERMCCGLWLERDYGRPAADLLADPEFVSKYVVHLARGLKAALMILNPARIVIGGGLSKAGDRLFVPLREELNRQMTAWSRARRDVVPAQLGDDSVLYGALALAMRHTISTVKGRP
jgi:glucokinase